MLWQDILLAADVDASLLVAALAKTLNVAEGDVELVDDIESATARPVSCHIQRKTGEFRSLLSVYVKDVSMPDDVVGAKKLSDLLGMRLLIDGGTDDPYVMQLVERGDVRLVDVDVEALDQRDEYVLAS